LGVEPKYEYEFDTPNVGDVDGVPGLKFCEKGDGAAGITKVFCCVGPDVSPVGERFIPANGLVGEDASPGPPIPSGEFSYTLFNTPTIAFTCFLFVLPMGALIASVKVRESFGCCMIEFMRWIFFFPD
jgi:hypothetical protein